MQRVDLSTTSHQVHRWWVKGRPSNPGHAVAGLGQLGDGRWFVARTSSGRNRAWLVTDERRGCEVIQAWIARRADAGLWRELHTSP